MRSKWLVVPALAVGLAACKKEEAPAAKAEAPAAETAPASPESPATTPSAPAAPAVPKATAEQRSAKLGFVKHLPQDVETVITVYGAAKTAERAKSLKFWKLIEDEMGLEADVIEDAEDAAKVAEPIADNAEATAPAEAPPAEVPAAEAPELNAQPVEDPAAFSPKDLWGAEVTLALGDTSGQQVGNLLHLYRRYGYFQMRQLTKTMIARVKGGGEGMAAVDNPLNNELIKDLVNDPEGGAAVFEKMGFPPIYVALKVDAAKREQAAQEIASSLGMIGSLPDMVEPLELEKAGAKFTGYKILGAKLAEQAAAMREELEKSIEADVLDRLYASLAKKDIVIMTGTIGDYVVLFLGGSPEQLEFASTEKESLAGAASLEFTDEYLSKDLAAMVYGDKESLELLMANASGLSDTAKGLRDGLAGESALGDTREIESLLQVVVDREEALNKFASTAATGVVAYYENGLKIESYGGYDGGSVDWSAAPVLGSLGDSPDVFIFANGVADAGFSKASVEFLESVAQTSYAIARKATEIPGDDPSLVQFREYTKLFDEKFRADAVGIWTALSKDMHEGLGRESALVIDLKGTIPTLPDVPQAVVDNGRVPRISVIAPVADRAKLASAWEKTNVGATNILTKVSEITGKDLPMLKPISSEKNGMTTWFYAMPFFTDDFMPSVTVGDKWFIASTSKNHALDLAAAAGKAAPGRKALVFKANFVALKAYADEMLKVLDENAEAVLKENAEDYRGNREDIQKLVEALGDFDSLTVLSTKESGTLRSSVHFKTR